MKAVVMAGGTGSRLRPLTIGRPKPLIPIVNKPVLAHLRTLLQRHNISTAVLTLQYLAGMIEDYFASVRDNTVEIRYSVESVPLGTAGSVKHAESFLDDTFLVLSGDALTDFNLTELVEFHRANGALATVALYRVPNPLEYGVITTDEKGRVLNLQEKPGWGDVLSDTVNTGIYVLEPELLKEIEPGQPVDFSKDVFPRLVRRGAPIFGHVCPGYWCDVGNLPEYQRANFDMLNGKVSLGPLGQRIGANIFTSGEVEIAPDATLIGPIYLGEGVKLKGGVLIQGPCVIRDYSVIDNGAQIIRGIILRNCYIGEGAEVRGAILGRQVSVKSKAIIYEGAVVGDRSVIGKGSMVYQDVKVWPEKQIEAGAVVRNSVIWASHGRRSLFGRYGVTGLVNVDITPEFAARLGAAFGAVFPRGSNVTINRDSHRSPRMIKRAIIAGLLSAGANAVDLRSMPIPVARYYTRVSDAVGGVHVRLSPYDNRVVDIRFFDGEGLNLNRQVEREIERTFFREDFRRVYLDEVGTISYAAEVTEKYIQDFLKHVKLDQIRSAGPQVVIDYANAPTALVLPLILNELNCDVVGLDARMDENKMAILPEELDNSLRQLASITRAVGARLGVRLDVGGEKVFVVDEQGHILSGLTTCALLMILALRAQGGGMVAVPSHAPRVFDDLAARNNGQIRRIRHDQIALMQAGMQADILLAADDGGNAIFPRFQPTIDGLMTTAKLIEFIVTQNVSLGELQDSLPPWFVGQVKVSCPWDRKGRVMRRMSELPEAIPDSLTEGLRLEQGGEWVLVIPDADDPTILIIGESTDPDNLQRLLKRYSSLTNEIIANP
ncbi:MAG: mannose-1-phosphate guanyltransferase [Chloroflexi bacterium]|nr:mannose-1-phosphate guanyltransferase [Chloroflexota bacterium]